MTPVTDAQQTLLRILNNVLFHAGEEIPPADWSAVMAEAEIQAVYAQAEKGLPEAAAADPAARAAWHDRACAGIATNLRVDSAHASLHRLLTANSVPYAFLKGYTSASYYDDPMLRAMGDVDFLISPERVDEISALMLANGYTEAPDENHMSDHHIAYKKAKIEYELHFSVNGIPDGEAGEICRRYLADCITTARPVTTPCGPMYLLDDFHHGLVCLLHIARHMLSSGMGLRHLCDWAVFVNAVQDFPALFEEKFRRLGLWTFACQMSALCARCFTLKVQPWWGTWPDALLDGMLQDILSAGNFGRKRDTNVEGWFISKNEGGGLGESNKTVWLFHKFNYAAGVHFPWVKHCVLLYPIGWLCVVIRYVFLMITGKRRALHLGRIADAADARLDIYTQYRLFEPEQE